MVYGIACSLKMVQLVAYDVGVDSLRRTSAGCAMRWSASFRTWTPRNLPGFQFMTLESEDCTHTFGLDCSSRRGP